nr:Ig-like domain-containing protein [Colwellia maritima]
MLAISGTSVEFPDNDPSKYYHLLITGIDGGGESGVSSLFSIPRIDGAPNLPPIANNDTYPINEDETISVNFLDNDQDPEEQLLSFDSIVQQPLNGTIELDELGNFIYTPQVNFHGKDTARYRIVDSEGGLSEGAVSFEVAPVNDDPIALDDVYGVDVNGQVSSQDNNVLLNDSDIDGDVLSVSTSIVENPIHGTVTMNANGSFSYISTDVLLENDQFVYQISDNNGGVSNATVTILPNVELLAPVAKNDDYLIDEDTTLLVSQVANGILANDSDPNNFSFELNTTLLVQPQHGQLNLSLDGTFTYIPDSNFYGVDQFQYQIENVANIVSQAFVSINVNRVSDIPIAVDDNYQVIEDETLTVTDVIGVLANDSDIDNETLSATIVSSPLSGTVNLAVDGSFTYLPNADFNGVDSFTYKITNEGELSSTGIVNIVVDAINDAPTTVTDNIVVDEDSNVIADVLANDSDKEGDLLSLDSVDVDNGTAVIVNNSISITPQQNFYGVLNASYIVSDIHGATSVGDIVVSVSPVNDLPIANNDNFNTRENDVLSIALAQSLLSNDNDIDNDTLTVNTTPIINVSNGSLVLNSNGTFNYTPNMNFDGTDNFTYQINDGMGGTSQANVVLTIIDTVTPNVAPIAVNDNFTIDEGSSPVITNLVSNHLLANDTDFENNQLTVNTTPISNVSNGSLTLSNDGSFTYIPGIEFNGTDSFTYQISDGYGTSQATATITINPINDLPQAVADTYTLNEDITFERLVSDVDQLLSNDTDIDLDTLTVYTTPVTNVAHGGLTLNADGSFTYIPNADFNGTDSFIYKISDGNGGTSQASVDLTITAINDAPTAVNQVFSIDEDKTNNDVVGTVIATDKELDNLSFALTGGDTGLFNIGSTTGVITVNGLSPLDYETSIQHNLTVTIADDGVPLNESTEIEVTINLIDTTEPVTLNETVGFGRPTIGFVELTGIKTQAKLTDSVRVGSQIYFVGNIDNVDKDIYIIAYDQDGKLDSGFGSSGIQTFDFGHDEYATKHC